jgi:hypothetical protein
LDIFKICSLAEAFEMTKSKSTSPTLSRNWHNNIRLLYFVMSMLWEWGDEQSDALAHAVGLYAPPSPVGIAVTGLGDVWAMPLPAQVRTHPFCFNAGLTDTQKSSGWNSLFRSFMISSILHMMAV